MIKKGGENEWQKRINRGVARDIGFMMVMSKTHTMV